MNYSFKRNDFYDNENRFKTYFEKFSSVKETRNKMKISKSNGGISLLILFATVVAQNEILIGNDTLSWNETLCGNSSLFFNETLFWNETIFWNETLEEYVTLSGNESFFGDETQFWNETICL